MKDLKHYFVSPKESAETTKRVSNRKSVDLFSKSDVLNVISSDVDSDISVGSGTLLKRSKRKRKEAKNSDMKYCSTEILSTEVKGTKISNGLVKKRRVSELLKSDGIENCVKENNGIQKNCISPSVHTRDSGNSGEYSLGKSSRCKKTKKKSILNEDTSVAANVGKALTRNCRSSITDSREIMCNESCTPLFSQQEIIYQTPENNKNLLNYFNKVDKLPEMEDKPIVMKVKALVHDTPENKTLVPHHNSNKSTPKPVKKRKSKKTKDIRVDYDLITSEELIDLEKHKHPSDSCGISTKKSFDSSYKNGITEDLNAAVNGKEDVADISSNSKNTKNCKKRKLEPDELEIKPSKKIVSDYDDAKILSVKKLNNKNPKAEINEVNESEIKLSTKNISNYNEEVLFVCETKNENPKPKKINGTLTSFFQIGTKKPTLTPEQKIAKRRFLNSGAPGTIKKKTVAPANKEGNGAPFPEKSHIIQEDFTNNFWNPTPVNLIFSSEEHAIEHPLWSSILPSQFNTEEKLKEETYPSTKISARDLKKELNLYPISCWYKELRKLRKGNENCIWTEKYRPHMASTFLANTRNICKLKSWLNDLKENSRSGTGESSGDEFVNDDDEQGCVEKKTVLLLSGSPGIGKTASVYAVAEEIGYHVLEINASYHRSGKRILNEFSEAMQSHKVAVLKQPLVKKKKKTAEDPKRNLILVEDADLLFEDDEGFISTLYNLASGSKRPMILVVNNSQVKHLSKLRSLCHTSLHFEPPLLDRLGSWLRTVSTVEGFGLNQDIANELSSTQDIRRSLLQLQFYQEKAFAHMFNVDEKLFWEKVGEYNLSSSTKKRKKALNGITSLATLDIITQDKTSRLITSPYWKCLPQDSTLNRECMESASIYNFNEYTSYCLKLMNCRPAKKSFVPIEQPRKLNDVETTSFSLSNVLNRRSNATDYWPTLRQISRNETKRLASHTKRNNRYFNYLSSIGISGPPDFIQSLTSTFQNSI